MRIARAHLDAKVETINRITGSPLSGIEIGKNIPPSTLEA